MLFESSRAHTLTLTAQSKLISNLMLTINKNRMKWNKQMNGERVEMYSLVPFARTQPQAMQVSEMSLLAIGVYVCVYVLQDETKPKKIYFLVSFFKKCIFFLFSFVFLFFHFNIKYKEYVHTTTTAIHIFHFQFQFQVII